MKIENVILTNRFFLLSNGDAVYLPSGMRRKELLPDETEAKVMGFEYDDKGVMHICPIRIVATCDSIITIEEKEKEFFLNHKNKINYFYMNLKKTNPNYKPEDIYEHIQE